MFLFFYCNTILLLPSHIHHKADILATMNGYDLESQNELYDVWETNLDFFEAVIDYYKDSKVVRCYAQGGVCDSDEE